MTEEPELKKKAGNDIEIVKDVNRQNHTRASRKYDTTCRFGFPKFPIWKNLISKPSALPLAEKEAKTTFHFKLLKDNGDILDGEATVDQIVSEYSEKDMETR